MVIIHRIAGFAIPGGAHLSPVQLIRQYQLRKAIELLGLGHNALETAYMVGIESPSCFTRVFREFYQQTPTD